MHDDRFEILATAQVSLRVSIHHYNDVIMRAIASQTTSLRIVYSTVYSRRRSKKTWKLHVTGLCVWNSLVTGEFPAQRASNAENVSIWWRHRVMRYGVLALISRSLSTARFSVKIKGYKMYSQEPIIIWNFCNISIMILKPHRLDLSHKSRNAPDNYPTMQYFVTEVCTFLLQNGALWDMKLAHCRICATSLFWKQYSLFQELYTRLALCSINQFNRCGRSKRLATN